MKHLIFARSIVVIFYINLIETDYVNKKIQLYTSAASLVESFDTVEQLESRLTDIADTLQIKEEDLKKITEHEAEQE